MCADSVNVLIFVNKIRFEEEILVIVTVELLKYNIYSNSNNLRKGA